MIAAGKIVEYLDNGKFICGFVTELQPKRIHLFNHNKREVKLPISRVIHCSKNGHAIDTNRDLIVKILQDTNDIRNSLMKEINLKEIWDIACDESAGSFSPSFLAELTFGEEATDDRVSAFLRSVFINRIFFKYKEGKIKVHSRDQVETLQLQEEKLSEIEKSVNMGKEILCAIAEQRTTADFEDEDLKLCLKSIQDYYLFGAESENCEVAKKQKLCRQWLLHQKLTLLERKEKKRC